MTLKFPQSDAVTLEAIVDRQGLHSVVELLAIVCGEKAEHIAVNWQDAGLAKQWDKAGQLFDTLAPKIDALKLP
jgi:hypothetical protein